MKKIKILITFFALTLLFFPASAFMAGTKTQGQDCSDHRDCSPGLTCQWLDEIGGQFKRCFPPLPTGKKCLEGGDCQTGSCKNNICESDGAKVCYNDDNCDNQQRCFFAKDERGNPNHYCAFGGQKVQNDSCKGDTECINGMTCQKMEDGGRRCFPTFKAGDKCQEDHDCQSGFCVNNKCSAIEAEEWPALVEPNLEVPLPNLSFSKIFAQETENGRFIYIPYLAQYAAALFKWLVGIAGIFAGLMITYAGVKWMLAAGNPENINAAKKRIGDAIIGLILVVGSYTIMYLINPDLVSFNSLKIQTVPKEIFYISNEETAANDETVPKNLVSLTNDKFTPFLRISMSDETMKALQPQTAEKLLEALKSYSQATGGQKAVATSATRTYAKQCELYKKYCKTSDCTKKSPNQCAPTTCMPGADPTKTKCPHAAGIAIDLWCDGGGAKLSSLCCPGGTTAGGCSSIASSCPCDQNLLIEKMRAAGFCRLDSEIWHFEYAPSRPGNKMSPNCR